MFTTWPSVSVVDLSLILKTVQSVLDTAGKAIQVMALFTIITGSIVLISTLLSWHGFIDDLTTEHGFDSQATCYIDVPGFFFDTLSMGVCTTRLWQTPGRLVQELNVCTVAHY